MKPGERALAIALCLGCAATATPGPSAPPPSAEASTQPHAPRRKSPAAGSYFAPGPAAAHSGLAARIEEMVTGAAARLGRPRPESDVRLDEAAHDLAAWLPDNGTPQELLQFALQRHGVVEPPARFLVTAWLNDLDQVVLDDIASRLPGVLSGGKYNRLGVGFSKRAGATRIVLALGETYLRLDPIPRALPAGAHITLRGRVLAPYRSPEVLVTTPAGTVERPALIRDGPSFRAVMSCRAREGRYQVEVMGEDAYGSQILANFPLYCGEPPPDAPPAQAVEEALVTSPETAEKRCFELLSADRARAGLPPLVWDDALAEVARGHSHDMEQHDFVGHVSPRTGGAVDRMRRAHLAAPVVLENVARANGPEESEQGLMDSPGHRANILSREVTHVGIGVALGRESAGSRELFVTQLFVRRAAGVGLTAGQAADDVLTVINGRRRGAHLPPLARDGALDRAAQEFSRAVLAGRAGRDQGQQATRRAVELTGTRYRQVATLFTILPEPSRLPETQLIESRALQAVGIGVAVGTSPDMGEGALFVTLVLAGS
ncbi:MAG TPA: CAP domain-containing protein [Polyangia bacterium]|nr:CAP domain-containing protein [Polyangia bacterium]